MVQQLGHLRHLLLGENRQDRSGLPTEKQTISQRVRV
jgi:hypothetical protein